MKHSSAIMAFVALAAGAAMLLPGFPAQASNSSVEDALQSRAELSQFAAALDKTGVLDALDENGNYTIFAPTNDAFSKIVAEDSSCFRSKECTDQLAAILRDHIVNGKEYAASIAGKGGITSLGTHSVRVEKTTGSGFKVNGHKIIGQNEVAASLIYVIDGTIATADEAASVKTAEKNTNVHVEAARAPFIPSRPSLIAPPATR